MGCSWCHFRLLLHKDRCCDRVFELHFRFRSGSGRSERSGCPVRGDCFRFGLRRSLVGDHLLRQPAGTNFGRLKLREIQRSCRGQSRQRRRPLRTWSHFQRVTDCAAAGGGGDGGDGGGGGEGDGGECHR